MSVVRFASEIGAELEATYFTAFRAAWPSVSRDAAAAWATRYSRRELARIVGGIYDLDALFRECRLDPAALARTEALAAWRTAQKASDDAAADDRSKKVAAFAAALLALFAQLQQGRLTSTAYLRRVGAAFDQAVADAPVSAAAALAKLRQTALDRAASFQDAVSLDDDEPDAPSEAQRANMASLVAGALWGATLVAHMHRSKAERVRWAAEMDKSTCSPCADLDGQEFDIDDAPTPGGDGPCDGQGNCRCTLEAVEEKAAVPSLVKVARCHQCAKKLAEDVNVGARLFCPRCRELVTVR